MPGAIDEDGRRVLQSLKEMFGDVATNHGCIINHDTDDNQPQIKMIIVLRRIGEVRNLGSLRAVPA